MGVVVKLVFSIEGVRCEVTGLQCRLLLIGDTSKTMVTYVKMNVMLSYNQLHFNTDLVTKLRFCQH